MTSPGCHEVKAVLARGEVLSPVHREHVESCRGCKALVSEVGPAELEALAQERAPAGLRERVFEAVAREAADAPSPRRVSRRWLLAGAAGLAVLVGGGLWTWQSHKPVRRAEELIDLMVADHLEYRDRDDRSELVSDDADVVAAWLRDELEVAARVVSLDDAALLGARHCVLSGQSAGLVFYRLPRQARDDRGEEEQVASLYVLHAPEADFTTMTPLSVDGRTGICRKHHLGLSAVAWNERGLTYVLVSELDDDDLSRLLSQP